MASPLSTALFSVFAAVILASSAFAQDNSGSASYSNTNGGVCPGNSNGLPAVSMNAAQFGGGSACGQCVQIQGTGNGAGSTPVSTAPYIAVVTNVCPSCAPGDIDLQESGSGKFGVTWSFVACPGAGRKLIEGTLDTQTAGATNGAVQEATEEQRAEGAQEVVINGTNAEDHQHIPQPAAEDSSNHLQGNDQEDGLEQSDRSADETQQPPATAALPASRKLLRGN